MAVGCRPFKLVRYHLVFSPTTFQLAQLGGCYTKNIEEHEVQLKLSHCQPMSFAPLVSLTDWQRIHHYYQFSFKKFWVARISDWRWHSLSILAILEGKEGPGFTNNRSQYNVSRVSEQRAKKGQASHTGLHAIRFPRCFHFDRIQSDLHKALPTSLVETVVCADKSGPHSIRRIPFPRLLAIGGWLFNVRVRSVNAQN